MVAIIMLVLNLILMGRVNADVAIVTIPAKPKHAPNQVCNDVVCNCYELDCGIDCGCWVCYEDEAYQEYLDEFTALFDSYETKWACNGALMIRKGNTGSYTFAKRSK